MSKTKIFEFENAVILSDNDTGDYKKIILKKDFEIIILDGNTDSVRLSLNVDGYYSTVISYKNAVDLNGNSFEDFKSFLEYLISLYDCCCEKDVSDSTINRLFSNEFSSEFN